jgi:hypothetical protein
MMKKLVRTLTALMLFTLALNGAIWAQSFDHKVRAEIPFSFYAGDKILPAGTYTFGFNMENHYLMIVNNRNADGALLMGLPSDAGKYSSPVLIFHANGEEAYTLESLKGADFGLSFNSKKTLSRVATDRTGSSTTSITSAP